MKYKLLQIINRYGINNQQRKLEEEVFELQEAIIENKYNSNKKHIAEEIADVTVLLDQIVAYYDLDIGKIINIREQKIDRQLKRIEIDNLQNK